MKATIHKDLSVFVKEMADNNGISNEGYLNNLVEKGIYAELKEDHTDDSVSAFMLHLRSTKECKWDLLVPVLRQKKAPTKPKDGMVVVNGQPYTAFEMWSGAKKWKIVKGTKYFDDVVARNIEATTPNKAIKKWVETNE